jgi:hypothetical protein
MTSWRLYQVFSLQLLFRRHLLRAFFLPGLGIFWLFIGSIWYKDLRIILGATMQASRRAFNPTSLPGLRAPRTQRRDFNNTGQIPRPGLRGTRNGGTIIGRWRGVRRESTETGEDKTGHISASSNEGILFFDSESKCDGTRPRISEPTLFHRSVSSEAQLGSAITMARRSKSARPPKAIQ